METPQPVTDVELGDVRDVLSQLSESLQLGDEIRDQQLHDLFGKLGIRLVKSPPVAVVFHKERDGEYTVYGVTAKGYKYTAGYLRGSEEKLYERIAAAFNVQTTKLSDKGIMALRIRQVAKYADDAGTASYRIESGDGTGLLHSMFRADEQSADFIGDLVKVYNELLGEVCWHFQPAGLDRTNAKDPRHRQWLPVVPLILAAEVYDFRKSTNISVVGEWDPEYGTLKTDLPSLETSDGRSFPAMDIRAWFPLPPRIRPDGSRFHAETRRAIEGIPDRQLRRQWLDKETAGVITGFRSIPSSNEDLSLQTGRTSLEGVDLDLEEEEDEQPEPVYEDPIAGHPGD